MTAEGSEEGKNPQDRIGLEDRPTGGGSHIPVGGHGVGRAGESAPSCMAEAAETGSCPSYQAPVCPRCYQLSVPALFYFYFILF